MTIIKRKIIKAIMNIFPAVPQALDLSLNEVFMHKNFTDADEDTKKKLMLRSAQWRYDYEKKYKFEKMYFKKVNIKKLLKNKIVLDLGCFTGGRTAVWAKRYDIKTIYGIDIDSVYIEAARLFSQKMGNNTHFQISYGEELPFEDNFFDAIITSDTFEHVRDLKKVLQECQRVLKGDGIIICSFPQYLSPFEHHLGFVTKTPCIHWFFKNTDIHEVYYEIIQERGDEAYWYKRSSPALKEWEKLSNINGTSIRGFRKMIKEMRWHIYFHSPIPILTTGRLFNKYVIFRLLSNCFKIFAKLPYLEELFCERIVYILKKPKQNIK